MRINKKKWTIGILFSFIIIFEINNVDASFFGNTFGGDQCHLWMPPGTSFNTDSQECDQCGVLGNIRGLIPCTEYSCHSLGIDCNFDEATRTCTEQNQNDRRSPVIEDCSAKDLVTSDNYNIKKQNKKCSIDGQVEAYSALGFYLLLDEAGECSISDEPAFDIQDGIPLTTETGGISRNQFFFYPTLSGEFNCNGLCTFYVKCADFNENVGDLYTLEFFVKDAPDRAPPMIFGYSLFDGAYIPLDTTNIAPFYLVAFDNEGVKECRYAESSTADYDSAELLQCSDTIDMGVGGWKCTKNGGLNTPNNENKYYFKCEDINGNKMPNWQEYKIYKSQNTLTVGITSPGTDVSGTSNSLTVGVNDFEQGIGYCRYDLKWRGGGDTTALDPSTDMIKQSDGIYSSDLDLVNSGTYDVKVECVDGVGQSATDELSFNYRNEPLSFRFNPSSVASATNDYLDVGLTVSGGREGKGNTWQCKYEKVGIDTNLNTLKIEDLDVSIYKSSSQYYSIRFGGLTSGVNRFYVMCEDFDARKSYYGEEYRINFNPFGLVVEEKGNSPVESINGNYETDLYVILSGGPDNDGSADCYYTDTYAHGIYDSFSTSQYRFDKFTKEDIVDYSGKSARIYTKTVTITPDIPNDFYVRCVDKYQGTTEVMKNTVLYTPSGSGGDTAPECTTDSDCDSGEVCSSGGYCITSEDGDSDEYCEDQNGVFCEQGYTCNGPTLDYKGSFSGAPICCSDESYCDSQGGNQFESCEAQSGEICIQGQVCDGQFIDSTDSKGGSARCCDGQCIFEDDTPLEQPLFYRSGSNFFVLTNKAAICYIKKNNENIQMNSDTMNRLHDTSIISEGSYEVKCTDNTDTIEFTAVYT